MELITTRAPIAALPRSDENGVLRVIVSVHVEANRHLPANVWLEVDRPLASFERQAMQGAPRPSIETAAIQKDASTIDLASDPSAFFVLLERAALLPGPSDVLPVGLIQQRCRCCNLSQVIVVHEMGSMHAATQRLCEVGFGVDRRAALPIDAVVTRQEERGIEHPAIAVIADEFDPPMTISRGNDSSGRHFAMLAARLSPMSELHDDRLEELRTELGSISERLQDLSIDILREAVDRGETTRPPIDKTLAAARRAVDKAVRTLDPD